MSDFVMPPIADGATLRPARLGDVPDISRLHARAFGPGRFARTAYRVREGAALVSPYCRVAITADGAMAAALRMTAVEIGGRPGALLLGPLAVAPELANLGFGRALIAQALAAARADGLALVLLVGDVPYYGRFGFTPVPHGHIILPGPVNPARLLGLALNEGALDQFSGLVTVRRSKQQEPTA
ncbi:MAG: N-acetyltransferase [Hyphomicrobiaceae bacterium]|nr:N-acetyltransferase [Hyphomicrobiaceae bacterium]